MVISVQFDINRIDSWKRPLGCIYLAKFFINVLGHCKERKFRGEFPESCRPRKSGRPPRPAGPLPRHCGHRHLHLHRGEHKVHRKGEQEILQQIFFIERLPCAFEALFQDLNVLPIV